MSKITFHGEEYHVLFDDMFRPLTKQEDEDLTQSIKEHGIMHSIVVDEDNGLIAGANRLRIAAKLRLPKPAVPIRKVKGQSEEQKKRMAEESNTRGRLLTAADRKKNYEERLKRVAVLRVEGKSTRDIGSILGLGNSQIFRDMQECVDRGIPCEPPDGKVIGKNKVKQKAKRKAKPKKKDASPVEKLKDSKGVEIPEKIKDIFADTWHVDTQLALERFKKEAKAAMKWSVWLDPKFLESLESALDWLKAAIPDRVCPTCHGSGKIEVAEHEDGPCAECRESGYLGKAHR
jgi:hypothetical protein